MFSHLLEPGPARRTRLGWGVALSAAVHLGLLGLVLTLTHRPPPVKEDLTEVHFAAMPAPPPPPAALTRRVAAARPPRPDRFLAPREVPRELPPPAEAPPAAGAGTEDDDDSPSGPVDGVPFGVPGGDPLAPALTGAEEVHDFELGMTRPQVDAAELSHGLYSQEAAQAQVEGTLIVKCQVLASGVIQRCKVLKPLPLVGEAVVRRLESMRVGPATIQGRPVSVDYVFNFRFRTPR